MYETEPVGGPPQGLFLNAAVLVECANVRALFETLVWIEDDLGRVRHVHWGPRTIDLDVLWAFGESIAEPDLVVPHPRLFERPFAIRPLLDVAPDAPYRCESGGLTVTDFVL